MSYKDWKLIKLSDIGEIITGKTPPTKQDIYWGGSIPFLTPSDDMNQKNIVKTLRYVTEKAAKDFNKNYLPIDSICVSCIGSDLGKVVKAKKRLITNQQINSIIPKKSYDSDFIYYSLTILGKKMNYLSKTSTAVPIINKSTFSKFEISIPHIKIQKSIANILSSLDDKIELNNKINKNLEEIAQTLYKQWFVDFEFPNEDGLPYKSSGGEMVDSELGMIPEGWEVIKLKDIFTYINGFAFKSKDYAEDGNFKVITIRNVKDGFFDLANVSKVVDVPGKIREDQILSIGDILISLTGNVGRVAIVDEKNCLLNQRVAKISSKVEYKGLVYTLLRNENIFNKVLSLGKGSAQQNLSPVEMSNIEIVFPKNINNEFLEQLNNIYLTLINNSIQNKKLAETRDLLLPKLMSGEIRIPLKE